MRTEFREAKTLHHTADLPYPPPVGARVSFPSGAVKTVTGSQLFFGASADQTRWVVYVAT